MKFCPSCETRLLRTSCGDEMICPRCSYTILVDKSNDQILWTGGNEKKSENDEWQSRRCMQCGDYVKTRYDYYCWRHSGQYFRKKRRKEL